MKKIHRAGLIWLGIFLLSVVTGFGQNVKVFESDFNKLATTGFDSVQTEKLLKKHQSLLFSFNETTKLGAQMQGMELSKFPLQSVANKKELQPKIDQLLHSKAAVNRLLGYLMVAATGNTSKNKILADGLVQEPALGVTLWIGMALMHLGYDRTSVLFPWVVKNNFSQGGGYLFPMYCALPSDSVRNTSWQFAASQNAEERIYAVQALAVTGYSEKSAAILRNAIRTWPVQLKGYALYSAKAIKMGDLLPDIETFIDSSVVRKTALESLANSPTASDRAFVRDLSAKNSKDKDILNALKTASHPEMVRQWLSLLPKLDSTDKYFFNTRGDSLLRSDEMLPFVLSSLSEIRNRQAFEQLLLALSGRTDEPSQQFLIGCLEHPESNVRYWATVALAGNCSGNLSAAIAKIVREQKYVNASTFDLAITCGLDTLQTFAEKIYDNPKEYMEQVGAVHYLATYPQPRHLSLFRSLLKTEDESGFMLSRLSARGLAALKDQDSVADIIRVSERERKSSGFNAFDYLEALAKLKNAQSKAYISTFLKDENQRVRETAQGILSGW